MRVCIYTITCVPNGKMYVGKTGNPGQRFSQHKWAMKKSPRQPDCNMHLWNACQKYGIEAFKFEVICDVDVGSEEAASAIELFWMDMLQSCDRNHGFNLRRDSSTKMTVHPETRMKYSLLNSGPLNPNYNNTWSPEQKRRMSEIARKRHRSGVYGQEWQNIYSVCNGYKKTYHGFKWEKVGRNGIEN